MEVNVKLNQIMVAFTARIRFVEIEHDTFQTPTIARPGDADHVHTVQSIMPSSGMI